MSSDLPREAQGSKKSAQPQDFLENSGEMGKLVRAIDWTQSPLGPIESWPQSLRTSISLCLAANFPIALAWGPSHVQIYNDGYLPLCGGKHPHSMGQDFRECWAAAWPVIGESYELALAGVSSSLNNQRMFLDRNGSLEETFFTFSFSPIRDESGGIGGLFHPVTETTGKMVSERRTRILRNLTPPTFKARTRAEVFSLAAQALASAQLDLPFALFYVVDESGKKATLTASSGRFAPSPACPVVINLEHLAATDWPLAEVVRTNQVQQIDNLEARFGPIPGGPYPESPQSALALPIAVPGCKRPLAVLIAGVSSRLPLDEAYRAFYGLLAAGITTAAANAHADQEERRAATARAEIERAQAAFFSTVSPEPRPPLTPSIPFSARELLARVRTHLGCAQVGSRLGRNRRCRRTSAVPRRVLREVPHLLSHQSRALWMRPS